MGCCNAATVAEFRELISSTVAQLNNNSATLADNEQPQRLRLQLVTTSQQENRQPDKLTTTQQPNNNPATMPTATPTATVAGLLCVRS